MSSSQSVSPGVTSVSTTSSSVMEQMMSILLYGL